MFGFFQDICGKCYIARAAKNRLNLYNMDTLQFHDGVGHRVAKQAELRPIRTRVRESARRGG